MDFDSRIRKIRDQQSREVERRTECSAKLGQIFAAELARSGPQVVAFLRKHRVPQRTIGVKHAPGFMGRKERVEARGLQWRLPWKRSGSIDYGLFIDDAGQWWRRRIVDVHEELTHGNRRRITTIGSSEGQRIEQLATFLPQARYGYDGHTEVQINEHGDYQGIGLYVALDGRVGIAEYMDPEPWSDWLVTKLDLMTRSGTDG